MKKEFTVEEIRNYLLKSDSLGDALHYLNENNIIEANVTEQEEPDDWDDESADD